MEPNEDEWRMMNDIWDEFPDIIFNDGDPKAYHTLGDTKLYYVTFACGNIKPEGTPINVMIGPNGKENAYMFFLQAIKHHIRKHATRYVWWRKRPTLIEDTTTYKELDYYNIIPREDEQPVDMYKPVTAYAWTARLACL